MNQETLSEIKKIHDGIDALNDAVVKLIDTIAEMNLCNKECTDCTCGKK
jgi:hypothetical protein